MNFADNICNTGLHLDLGLGLGPHDDQTENCMKTELRSESQKNQEEESYKYDKFYPSLTLGLPDEVYQIKSDQSAADHKLQLQTASSPSAVSNSFSNSSNSIIKRERDRSVAQEVEKLISRPSTGVGQGDIIDEDGNNLCRKKLRLTKQQSAVLEDSFRDHSTLNPKQKQELARKLNLRARQVEVWFQNRRARTKLKQTEVDCELLKKCCETLTEENKRLQKELQELKSMKTAAAGAFYMQLPATTLTICPSCERICSGGGSSNGGASATTPFFIGSSKGHNFYKSNYSFTHSSAAC